jgi:hypothetical protein
MVALLLRGNPRSLDGRGSPFSDAASGAAAAAAHAAAAATAATVAAVAVGWTAATIPTLVVEALEYTDKLL